MEHGPIRGIFARFRQKTFASSASPLAAPARRDVDGRPKQVSASRQTGRQGARGNIVSVDTLRRVERPGGYHD